MLMYNKCKCDNRIEDQNIIHECEYSKWGWFLLTVLGLSAKPKKVDFTCLKCGQLFSTSSDPEVLKKFIGR